MISVFVYEEPVEPEGLVLQESEVEEVRYFDLLEVYEEICRGSDWCCVNPEGMKVLVEYLGGVGERDSLESWREDFWWWIPL